MSTTFTFDGMEAFKEALRQLPEELSQEGGDIVVNRAQEAAQDIASAYAEVTGDLKSKVKAKVVKSSSGAVVVVKSTSKIAYIYEIGTEARHTSLGPIRGNRGRMKPANIFIPKIMGKRRAMEQDLIALLKRAGLEVRLG